MRRTLTLTLLLTMTIASAGWAEQARRVPQEYLDQIVDDDPNRLPRYMTPAERQLPLPLVELLRTPPSGEISTPAEYEKSQGLLIRWGYYNAELTALAVGVTTGDPEAVVYILVTGTSQQNSATSVLVGAGADLGQVEFITYYADTVWIRDYGPRFIFSDGWRAMVDHTYNRPRPNDNAFPDYLSALWGEPEYDLPLTHGGGNFHFFANREAFMSSLILDENPSLTEQQVRDYFLAYENLDLTIYEGFPTSFDSTQHIDMWMLPVEDGEVIIGEYASSAGLPYQITESAVVDFTSRGYTVYRTPGWNSSGTHYTYTNAVILNSLVFVPSYGGSYTTQDSQAQAVFASAFENHQIIPVDSSSIIHAAGALHCIVMQVPAYGDHEVFADDFESGDSSAWTITVGSY